MDLEILGRYIEKVAVRVGFGENANLQGTGVFYVVPSKKRAAVLTAGHVLYKTVTADRVQDAVLSVKTEGTTKDIRIELACDDCKLPGKNINTHYCPGFGLAGGKYVWDAALIEVPWEEWMTQVPEIHLGSARPTQKVRAIGFPKSTDNEATAENLTAGKMLLKAEIPVSPEDEGEKRFYFSYEVDAGYPIHKDSYMIGFSGSGLFSFDAEIPRLLGLVSQSHGTEDTGDTVWAVSSFAVRQLLQEQKLLLKDAELDVTASKLEEEYLKYPGIFMRESWEEMSLSTADLKKTHQETYFADQFRCNKDGRCEMYWKGRSKAAVYVWVLLEGHVNTWEDVQIGIQTEAGEIIPVNLEFLCAEGERTGDISSILRTLITQGGFSEKRFPNQTIFMWNADKPSGRMPVLSKSFCERIIGSIVRDKCTCTRDQENMFHVTRGDPEKVQIAIMSLDVFQQVLEELSFEEKHYEKLLKREDVRKAFMEKLKEVWK